MGRGLLTEISRLIKKLAQNHNIAIVVTNYAVTGKDDTLKPGLGEAWSYAPHAQIMLRYSGVVENGNKILEAKLTRSSRNVRIFYMCCITYTKLTFCTGNRQIY